MADGSRKKERKEAETREKSTGKGFNPGLTQPDYTPKTPEQPENFIAPTEVVLSYHHRTEFNRIG